MDFIAWHYTKGLDDYLNKWIFYVRWISHYFSLPLLIKTLFSPWKRLLDEDDSPGFNITRFFEALMYNAISRTIGAIVRFFLFWAGLLVLVIIFFGGAFGVVLWIVVPLVGIPNYLDYKNQPSEKIKVLVKKIKSSKGNISSVIAESIQGEFMLKRLGISASDFIKESNIKKSIFTKKAYSTFEEIADVIVKSKPWSGEFLRRVGLVKDDISVAAKWWDQNQMHKTGYGDDGFGRPGIGLELLFGYTPNLNRFSINMGAPQSFSHRLIGRENVVSRMERVLNSGSSIVLIGKPGVGKRTVVLEFAHRAAYGKLGPKMAYRRILELDYNFLLSETSDLNRKKSQLAQILSEAVFAGNIVLMIRDIQRLTNKDVEGYDFTDIFEEYMQKHDLKIIAVSTLKEYERFIASNMRLRKFLKEVEVVPPNKKEAMEILVESAIDWEQKKGCIVTVPAIRRILELSDRYITEVPFPEKALELLEAVVLYKEQFDENTAGVEDVNVILAEKTGISFAHITQQEKKRLGNIEEIIHKRLINQDSAVNLIGKSLRGRSVGVKKENKPVGSFLFMGPTGVGKTETAKVLANVYYGSQDEILRFDMAEYAGREGLERLIGSSSKNQPGVLTTAIKNNPASLLLIDEIEKAKPEIFNLFLTLLDEGKINDAFGRKINCSHLFVIATSNAGAEHVRQIVSKGVMGEDLQKDVVNYVLEKGIFSPEFINRFDGVVVYEPLKQKDLVSIAKLQLDDLETKMKQKGIEIIFGDDVAQKIADEGYDPAFGARPMRRIIDLELGDLVGKAILGDTIKEGDKVKISAKDEKNHYDLKKMN